MSRAKVQDCQVGVCGWIGHAAVLLLVLGTAVSAQGADVAHEGFSSPTLINIILSEGGHTPTALSAEQVEAGQLLVGDFDVFVISRNTTFPGASDTYVQGVGDYIAAGGNIVTEFSGAGLLFSSYAPDIRPPVDTTPQLGIFSGSFHAGWFHATGTPINLLDPGHPAVAGLPDPFSEGTGTEFFFWLETDDPNIQIIADFVGNGTFGFPTGQDLPTLAVGCSGNSTFVFGTWCWNDTLNIDGHNKQFFLNAVGFAASGGGGACIPQPVCDAGGPYAEECQGETTEVQLDGSGSSGTDPGEPLTFLWTTDCPGGTFNDNTLESPILTIDTAVPCAPLSCNVFLTVDDGTDSTECQSTVSVSQLAFCDAGGPYSEECGGETTEVQLDGSGSSGTDPGDPLTFLWTTDCPGGTFNDNTLESPTLTIDTPSCAPLGCDVFLTVDDGADSTDCQSTVTVSAGGGPCSVLWVGPHSLSWNDGSAVVTQISISQFAEQNLAGFGAIYVDSEAVIKGGLNILQDRAADISAFVSGGGGLISDNGGNFDSPNFIWVPNSGSLAWVTQDQDTVLLTALGMTHPVTVGTTDAGLSGWGQSQHNYFTATGGMDVLATGPAGQANVLTGTFGSGRLVLFGLDPAFHQPEGDTQPLIRQAVAWACGLNPQQTGACCEGSACTDDIIESECFGDWFKGLDCGSGSSAIWELRAPFDDPRTNSGIEGAAASLIGNKIYVSHGYRFGDGDFLSIYDIPSDSWTHGGPSAPDAAVIRSELAGGTALGKHYAIGGRTGPTDANEEFDPGSDTWASRAPMPGGPRGGQGGASFQDQIYIIGGRTGGTFGSGTILSLNERYTAASDTWTTLAPLLTAVSDNYATVAHEDKIYVFGGATNSSTVISALQIYDIATDSWSLGAPLPTPRAAAMAGVCGDDIYVFGGFAGAGGNLGVTEVYNTVTNTWSAGPPMAVPVSEMAQGITYDGAKIYSIGSGIFGSSGMVVQALVCPTVPCGAPPVCDAGGPYAEGCEGDTTEVQLDGSGSSGSDPGDPITFLWTTDCPGGTFDDDTLESPTLTIDTAPCAALSCNVFLTVDDGTDSTDCQTTVTVNQLPVCDAGGPYAEECEGEATEVQLDGSGSGDPDPGDAITFLWTTDCPGATFDNNTLESPTLTIDTAVPCAPLSCNVFLTVDDGADSTDCQSTVTVSQLAFCDAGGPYAEECQGETTEVQLDGSGSSATNPGDPITFLWTTDCLGGTFNDNTLESPTLTIDTAVPAAGGEPCSVLWVGPRSLSWNDGSAVVTQISVSQFAEQNLAGFGAIYVDSEAVIDGGLSILQDRAADISAFVSGGGGLITDNGGNWDFPNFSWVPNSGSIAWVIQDQESVFLTALGMTHPVTVGTTNAGLSGWGQSQHNYFTATGGMDVLATNPADQANVLTGTFGLGRLVLFGLDPAFHQPEGDTQPLIRQAVAWACALSSCAPLSCNVFLTVDDGADSTDCQTTVTVEDTTDPEIICPGNLTLECDGAGNIAAVDDWLAGTTGNDACGSVTIAHDFAGLSDDCGATGSATVMWTATDECGRTSSCTATVTVEDTIDPSIKCPSDLTLECDGAGNIAAVDDWLASTTGSDACGGVNIVHDFAGLSDDCGATGSATVTWTATDECDRTSTCMATVIVEDTTDPEILCPDNLTLECDGAGNTAAVNAWLADVSASDTCGGASIANDFAGLSDDCGATGSATVIWTATDDCGRTSTCMAAVTVEDTTDPEILCPDNLTLECDGAGNTAAVNAWLADVSASDTCGGVSIASDFAGLSDDCGATGSATVMWTATDECGRTSTCMATVIVEDTTDPSIDLCPAAATVECDGAGNTAELNAWLDSFAASDICSDVTLTDNFKALSDDCGETGSATVEFTATDDCERDTSCESSFVIEDTTPPEITCPDDVTIISGDSTDPDAIGSATATDACDQSDLTIVFADEVLIPDCLANPVHFVIEREWTATDDCGLSSSCLQTITVMRQEVSLIIKQGACPAPVNPNSNGVVPMLLTGDTDFDVNNVLLGTLRVTRCDCTGGNVAPNDGPPGPKIDILDLNHPFDGNVDCVEGPCACNDDQSSDGIDDIWMKYRTDDMMTGLPLASGEGVVVLSVTGELDESAYPAGAINVGFIANDCALIVPPGADPINATMESNVLDTFIEVTPLDLNVDSDGFANFGRAYFANTLVTVTAPPSSAGRPFLRWKVDGVLQTIGLRTLEVEITSDVNLEAIYRRSSRIDPDPPTEGEGDME